MMIDMIKRILSDPNFIPRDDIMSFDLNQTNLMSILLQLSRESCVAFAVREAELVLPLFEAARPEDDRPRKAILAAKDYLINPLAMKTPGAALEAARRAHTAARNTNFAFNGSAYAAARAAAYTANAADAGYNKGDVYSFVAYVADYASYAIHGSYDIFEQLKRFLGTSNGLNNIRHPGLDTA